MSGVATVFPESRAAKLRGFGPLGLLAILVIFAGAAISQVISAPLILLWAAWSRTPWSDIGYIRPKKWGPTIAGGMLAGVVLKLAMKAVVMPLLGAEPINRAYHYMAHNPAATLGLLLYIPLGAGVGEETFFRGYLFERLGRLMGASTIAKGAIVLLTTALFGIVHYPVQGVDGAVQAVIVGLVFGAVYAASGRLFPLMIAHATFDLTAVALIFFDVETKVAHLIFK